MWTDMPDFFGHLVPNPMSPNQRTPRAPGRKARVSPAAAPGSNVVDLVAWCEARRSRANVPAQRGGVATCRAWGTNGPRPDRLGHALAWCQAFSTTGRNPFDPARLQQGLD